MRRRTHYPNDCLPPSFCRIPPDGLPERLVGSACCETANGRAAGRRQAINRLAYGPTALAVGDLSYWPSFIQDAAQSRPRALASLSVGSQTSSRLTIRRWVVGPETTGMLQDRAAAARWRLERTALASFRLVKCCLCRLSEVPLESRDCPHPWSSRHSVRVSCIHGHARAVRTRGY